MSTSVRRKNLRYERDVLASAGDNHIWLNAFACVRPTPEFLQSVGAQVLRMLASDDNTILCDHDGGILEDLKQRELILRVNKS